MIRPTRSCYRRPQNATAGYGIITAMGSRVAGVEAETVQEGAAGVDGGGEPGAAGGGGVEPIRLVYAVDPLPCPRRAGALRAIALIQEPAMIDGILRHLRSKGRDSRAGPWSTGKSGAQATASLPIAPEKLALIALRERFLAGATLSPQNDWKRGLIAVARDGGVSLPDSAPSGNGHGRRRPLSTPRPCSAQVDWLGRW